MAIIQLIGPNAIGKTTAARRYADRYKTQLTVMHCDNQLIVNNGVKTRDHRLKATMAEKQQALEDWRSHPGVCLFESARNDMLRLALSREPIIFVVCTAKMHERNMRARCEAKGKKYRADYWVHSRLEYECCGRYVNFAQKNLAKSQYTIFELNDQERDWPAVDEYFYTLFRKLHNVRTK